MVYYYYKKGMRKVTLKENGAHDDVTTAALQFVLPNQWFGNANRISEFKNK